MDERIYQGGCLCGAVRYRAVGPVRSVVYCHCSQCRRASGAPVVAWAAFFADRFAFTTGEPRVYASSHHAERRFCGTCGTQLTFNHHSRPEETDVAVTTLDQPTALRPQRHIFAADRMDWLVLDDGLPRYPAEGPASG